MGRERAGGPLSSLNPGTHPAKSQRTSIVSGENLPGYYIINKIGRSGI